MLLHEFEELFKIELRHGHDSPAHMQHQAHHDDHPVNVIERQNADHDIVVVKIDVDERLRDIGCEIAMREHDAFGQPGCAAGIGQHNQIIRADQDIGGRIVRRHERGKGRRVFRLAKDENLFHAGFMLGLKRFGDERRDGDEIPRPAVVQLGRHLSGGIERIDRRDDAAA